LNESSNQYKKIALIVISASAVVSLSIFMGFAMLTGLFTKAEKLEITSYSWSDNLDTTTIFIENSGETALTISQLSINNTILSHEEWVCYPSHILQPGDQAYVYASPSLISFKQSSIYILALTTQSGKTFKRTLVTPTNFTFRPTEQLEIQGCTFSGTSGDAANTIVLTVQNTGTADSTIGKYKLGVSGTQHDIADVLITQGATTTVTCTTGADGEPWSAGYTYDIYLITSSGKQYLYRATAP
jgi:hypothetical protein